MMDLGDYRILVAEDDYLLSTDMAQALERAGACVVGPAATKAEALRLLGGGQIDGAVIDVGLRDGEAGDLLAGLRGGGVPFVIVSGYEPERFSHLAAADDFFPKPAMAERVLNRLSALIAAPASPVERLARSGERRRAAGV